MLDIMDGGLAEISDWDESPAGQPNREKKNAQLKGGDNAETVTRKKTKSGLPFPYVSLDEVASIAQVMQQCGGVPLTRDQLASKFEASSYFGVKVAASLLFNVVDRRDGRYSLTELGRKIASGDERLARSAYVKAFLSVELYDKMVVHFRGMKLPEKDGIEDALVEFGVTPKLKTRARWAFEKSAAFAGFYNASKDRLVTPILGDDTQPNAIEPEVTTTNSFSAPEHPAITTNGDDPSSELLIRGMLNRLPKIGTKWNASDRARWLKRLSNNLAELYDPTDDTEIKISVVSEPESGRPS